MNHSALAISQKRKFKLFFIRTLLAFVYIAGDNNYNKGPSVGSNSPFIGVMSHNYRPIVIAKIPIYCLLNWPK